MTEGRANRLVCVLVAAGVAALAAIAVADWIFVPRSTLSPVSTRAARAASPDSEWRRFEARAERDDPKLEEQANASGKGTVYYLRFEPVASVEALRQRIRWGHYLYRGSSQHFHYFPCTLDGLVLVVPRDLADGKRLYVLELEQNYVCCCYLFGRGIPFHTRGYQRWLDEMKLDDAIAPHRNLILTWLSWAPCHYSDLQMTINWRYGLYLPHLFSVDPP